MLGHAFSGLILMYNRALRRGDYVRIGDNEGTVMELGIYATRIQTGLGEEITLPSSGIMAGRQTEISVSPSPMPPAAYGMRWQYYGYYTGAWRSY